MDAPASDTITYLQFNLNSLIISAQNFSDSRDAVPFPIAIISTLYFSIKFLTIILLCSIYLSLLEPFKNGLITVESKYLPVESITANLHPLTYPGSKAKTIFSFIGGCKSKLSKFLPKLSIADTSAISVKSLLISLSILGLISLL